MEFRVLGQLEAWRDGERMALGPIKQRSLLALLLIHANQAVSTDLIIDELWGEEPAGDRHNALWIQVSKLRSALEPGRIPRSDGTVVTTRSPGYVVQVEPDHVDAHRFELLVEEARACAPSDPALSSLRLTEGLALWRGRAYEEFAYESFAQAEISRLDELRVEAVELRLDADLRCGWAEELVAELQSLVHQHPLREHLSAQLMLALYRSDRRADALRAFGRLRRRLAEELGLDPSAALQRLEQQIICGDPALDVLAARPSHPARPAVRGYELREQIGISALGLTYRAYHPAAGRELSLTVVSPELAHDSTFIRRFQASADVANALAHPNLLGIDDLWQDPGGTYVVTRLIAGGSLESCLQHGPLTLDDAVAIVGDVASAVATAHQRGYVHGGIETETVLVEGNHGFLHGFGFVPSGTTGGPTMVGGGDEGFDAPEQLIGGPLTPCTDVFRLGRVLERALRGHSARGNNPSADIPIAVTDLIGQATAERPGNRPQDAAAFAVALHDALDSASDVVPKVVTPTVEDHPDLGLQALAVRGAIKLTGPERAFVEEDSIDHRDAHQVAAQDEWVREIRPRRKRRRRIAVLMGGSAALIAVTTVAASQVAHSRATDRFADASTQAHRLAVASTGVATTQPDLAMLLALQSLTTSAQHHLPALAEAEDALQWAVQGAGLTYPTSGAPVDVRRGPDGLTGVFRVSLPALVGMARGHLTRGFTAAECQHYSLHPCPTSTNGLASPAGTGAAPIPSPPPPTSAAAAARPLAGTTVTLLDAGWGSAGLDAELDVFEAATGINVNLVRPKNHLEPTFDRLPDGTRPDVTLVTSPGVLRTLAEGQRLVDVGAYLDRDAVRAEIGDELTTQATVGSGLYWLPLSFDLKGLVWYPPRAFREAGYQVPRTMDELVALANEMAAAGRTPWCLANGRGPESGWPVADWLGAMVLRVDGTELYDRWTKHDVPFDHPDVRRAGALLNEVLFGPGFLHGGPSWSNQRDPDDAVPSLLGDPPACWMLQGSSSTINILASGTARLGEDVDYFTLPPLRAGGTAPAEGGGVAAAAMSDRPEVRELMRYFASATWGRVAASRSTSPFIPARTQLYVVDCVDQSATLAANGVRVRLCQDARAAMRSGRWRFDAADEMPTVIGGLRPDHTGGAFLQGMVDYVEHGPDSLDRVLTEIDDAWP